jgi:hypothetical protein
MALAFDLKPVSTLLFKNAAGPRKSGFQLF